MNKIKVNYFVDAVALISFLITAITGTVIFLFLPPGEGRGREHNTILGYGRHDWGNIHDWAGIVMLVVVIIHIILHWKWIIATTKIFFKGNQTTINN